MLVLICTVVLLLVGRDGTQGVPGLAPVHWCEGWVLSAHAQGLVQGGCGFSGPSGSQPAGGWGCVLNQRAAWPEAFQYW